MKAGTPIVKADLFKYASGEKLLSLFSARFRPLTESSSISQYAAEELRHRYLTFTKVILSIVSSIQTTPKPADGKLEHSIKYHPLYPDAVKFHSLRELIRQGRISKDDVILILYECEPLLEHKFTREEILSNPFRDICGLPEFLEDYHDELVYMGLADDDDDDDDDELDDKSVHMVGRSSTNGRTIGGYNSIEHPFYTKNGDRRLGGTRRHNTK
jgi:hypothetical protein